jgi:hypothetical protein
MELEMQIPTLMREYFAADFLKVFGNVCRLSVRSYGGFEIAKLQHSGLCQKRPRITLKVGCHGN